MFYSFADAPYAALTLRRVMGLLMKKEESPVMSESDFLPDHMGVADSHSPVTLRDVAFSAQEADRGVVCRQSGKPVEITRISAIEHYDASELNCQTCRRCC